MTYQCTALENTLSPDRIYSCSLEPVRSPIALDDMQLDFLNVIMAPKLPSHSNIPSSASTGVHVVLFASLANPVNPVNFSHGKGNPVNPANPVNFRHGKGNPGNPGKRKNCVR